MQILIAKDKDEMSAKAAEMTIAAVRRKPDIVLGLATGSTPLGLYAALVNAHKEDGLDFWRDGHLGFNEPGSSLASRTQVVTLARETIEDNARLFESEEDVPKFAVTMGVQTILAARTCLLLAHGENKAVPIRDCVEGPITAMCTASALQLHPNAVIIVDEAAASKLERIEYYRWVQEAQPLLADKM